MKQINRDLKESIQDKNYHHFFNLVRDNSEEKVRVKPHNFLWLPIRDQINFTFLNQFNLL